MGLSSFFLANPVIRRADTAEQLMSLMMPSVRGAVSGTRARAETKLVSYMSTAKQTRRLNPRRLLRRALSRSRPTDGPVRSPAALLYTFAGHLAFMRRPADPWRAINRMLI
jgi:hypothetical protein